MTAEKSNKPVCDGCGTSLGVRLVEVRDPDGLITTCDRCESTLNSKIVREVRSYA
jgi:hypothetical protein